MNKQTNSIFEPFTFQKGITLKNKVAMAPMTTWASNDIYTVSEDEERHYKAHVNGVGIVITGCSHVTLKLPKPAFPRCN